MSPLPLPAGAVTFVAGRIGTTEPFEPNVLCLCALNAIIHITTVADKASRAPAAATKTLSELEVQRDSFSRPFSSIFMGRLPNLFIEVRRTYTTGCGDQQSSAQHTGDRTSIQLIERGGRKRFRRSSSLFYVGRSQALVSLRRPRLHIWN